MKRLVPILAVALLLRLAFLWQYQHDKPHQALGAIPFLFEPGNIAYSLAQGHGFSSPFRVETGPTAWMTPVYPLILAAIFRVFGVYTFQAFLAAALLNILFSVATCVPIYLIGRRFGVPSLATWLWAVFPNAILLPVESIWETSLTALLVASIIWLTLRMSGGATRRIWVVYSLLWGFALMVNATMLAMLPFLLAWLLYETRRVSGPALALCIILLSVTPWTIRNYLVFHAFVPLRSALGLQLWVGNNEHAEDRSPGQLHPIDNPEERSQYIELGELRYMHGKLEDAVAYMTTHPRRELDLVRNRFIAVWTGGTPHPIEDFIRLHSFEFRLILLFNLFVAAGTAMGLLVLIWRGDARFYLLAPFPLVLPFAYYLTLASARYRHPIDPVIMVLTAIAVRGGASAGPPSQVITGTNLHKPTSDRY